MKNVNYTVYGLLAAGLLLGLPAIADGQPAAFDEVVPDALEEIVEVQAQEDTIYKTARRAMNQGDYRRAVELYAQAMSEEPQYAADALYYQALAYQKMGGNSNYRAALGALERQFEQYPDAATRNEAEALSIRIQGELARQGDARAAEALQREAARMEREMEHDVQREVARAEVDVERQHREIERQQAEIERMSEREMEVEVRRQHAVQEAADQEAEMKMFALQALMESDPETAIPILENILTTRTPETAMLRQQAVFLLARMDDDARSTDLMLDIMQNDPDPEVQMHAAHWLARSNDPRAMAALTTAAQSGDPELQEAAVFALGQMPGPQSSAALKDIASKPGVDPEVRAMAIHGLAMQPSAENAQYLEELFRTLPKEESDAREAALFALSRTPNGVSGDFLYSVASDPNEDPDIREMALFAAARNGSLTPARLSQIYRDAETQDMKEQIMFALTQSEDPAAFDVLLEIARTETDPELKQNAVFWVGHSDDPRAKALMLEILEQ